MKKTFLGTVLTVLLIAGFAYGHNNGLFRNGGHHMSGGDYMQHGMYMHGGSAAMPHAAMTYNGCPGFGAYDVDRRQDREFLDATVSLRREIHNKRFELMEASRNPATSADEPARLEKEINDLRTEMHNLAGGADSIR